jgi:hypothetical protein
MMIVIFAIKVQSKDTHKKPSSTSKESSHYVVKLGAPSPLSSFSFRNSMRGRRERGEWEGRWERRKAKDGV